MPERPLGQWVDWSPAALPRRVALRGQHVLVRPISPADAEALYAVSHPPGADPAAIWTYLPDGPYETLDDYRRALEWEAGSEDPLYFTLARLPGEEPQGQASYLRMTPKDGTIEIGHIWFGTPLQRTTAATEAIYLMARYAFEDLGYRRFEWKCNALNAPSRRAAERFGFTFEGVFRNHMVVKGRNRDTAWYAIVDSAWPAVREGFERWLAPGNRDEAGRQRQSLKELIQASL